MSPLIPLSLVSQEKDAPLLKDISLLDRVLQRIMQKQLRPSAWQAFESLLNTSQNEDVEPLLDRLSSDEISHLIRLCSLYAQLFNLAEDIHHQRRRHYYDLIGAEPRQGSIEDLLNKLQTHHITSQTIQEVLNHTQINAVLTAHPTEVQRQTFLTLMRKCYTLLSAYDRPELDAEDRQAVEEALEANLLSLWQSDETRHFKITVSDEITNGVAYFELSFFDALTKLYRKLSRGLKKIAPELELPNIITIGSWIGGDHDGNPYVDANTLKEAFAKQAYGVFHYYRRQLESLYDELSLSTRRVKVDDAVLELAENSPETSISRAEEPYRKAIALILSRLLAAGQKLGVELSSQYGYNDKPYASAQEFAEDLKALRSSLLNNGSAQLAGMRLNKLIRCAGLFVSI